MKKSKFVTLSLTVILVFIILSFVLGGSRYFIRQIDTKATNGHTWYYDGTECDTEGTETEVSFTISTSETPTSVQIQIYGGEDYLDTTWVNTKSGNHTTSRVPEEDDVTFQIRVNYDSDPGVSNAGSWTARSQ